MGTKQATLLGSLTPRAAVGPVAKPGPPAPYVPTPLAEPDPPCRCGAPVEITQSGGRCTWCGRPKPVTSFAATCERAADHIRQRRR